MQRIALTTLLALSLALGGCVFAPGDNHEGYPRERVAPTVGQQLLDLDRARDKGVISESEFERAKRDILESARK